MNDGGPAFPRTRDAAHGVQYGMTLRDYFAAKALGLGVWTEPECLATYAYQVSDAMLAERAK